MNKEKNNDNNESDKMKHNEITEESELKNNVNDNRSQMKQNDDSKQNNDVSKQSGDVSINKKEHEELKTKFSEIKDTLQRVYAEFQNYRKRTDDEKQKFMELSNEDFIKKILPILDNFELALRHKKTDDDFTKAVELIYAQLTQIIEDEGVKIVYSGGKFDPKLHEVLMTEESDKDEGVILEEFQKGYTLGGRILRHAKVKIAKNKKK
jgi:molecular chaperone GrpE